MIYTNKIVVITGGGRGLGARFASDLAAQGASVHILARNEERLQTVRDRIRRAGGVCEAHPCDISDESAVKRVFKNITNMDGTVDILINNAAYHKSISIEEMPLSEWQAMIDINLTGAFLCCREVIPGMKNKKYGKILNISSSAAKHYFPGFSAYAASKAGLISLTNSLSEELKMDGINVNAIYLGMTNTEYTRERLDSDKAVTIHTDDMLQEDEVSRVVQFLVSDDSAPMMGASVDVFGKKS
ncbi:MAG: SDR family NAD(P)-dependent oxidoreductase [Spirochaetales bacterium]|nr:SDR family NAD(P)-dependent oxidoreductase [Spirochaetales bacterium]